MNWAWSLVDFARPQGNDFSVGQHRMIQSWAVSNGSWFFFNPTRSEISFGEHPSFSASMVCLWGQNLKISRKSQNLPNFWEWNSHIPRAFNVQVAISFGIAYRDVVFASTARCCELQCFDQYLAKEDSDSPPKEDNGYTRLYKRL